MKTEVFEIDNHEDLHLIVMEGKFTGIRYIVEDKEGTVCGSSKINWKKALYNYNKNKKKEIKGA